MECWETHIGQSSTEPVSLLSQKMSEEQDNTFEELLDRAFHLLSFQAIVYLFLHWDLVWFKHLQNICCWIPHGIFKTSFGRGMYLQHIIADLV